MGHTRLGQIPKSKKWSVVVDSVLVSLADEQLAASVPAIASQTLSAASSGMLRAAADPGLVYSFYVLAQLGLAGRGTPIEGSLPFEPLQQESLFSLLGEVQLSIDDYVLAHGGSTDYSEMAQHAAGDALLDALEPTSVSLFGSGADELRAGLRTLSSGSAFADLSQQFFGDFLSRFLNFYLSRVTTRASEYEGFRQVLEFNQELRQYSYQSAAIVRDFASAWVSKTAYLEGITLENTRRFMAVAVKKLAAELARGEVPDGRP